jgi:hypothetical protein
LSILDRFRRQPEWKHRDPVVRAEAVRRLATAEHHDLLVGFAQADADPAVRRAAVRKLADPEIVAALARADADEGVRQAAAETLVELASSGTPEAAEPAAAAVENPRHLATLAREATLATVRLEAVGRLSNGRALAALARAAEDPEVRRLAVARIAEADAEALLEVALKSEHKDAALTAVERLDARDALEAVAARARSKPAARRARAIADERWPPRPESPPPAEPAPPADVEAADKADAERYDALAARQAEEAGERASRAAARVTLCEQVESIGADEDPHRVDDAVLAWGALPVLEGVEAETLQRRFEGAVDAWRARRRGFEAGQDRRARMEALCAELEAVAELPDAAEAARRQAEARKSWSGLQSMEGVDSDLQDRYARAVARLEAKGADARKEHARREEEARARLEFLCGRVEELAAAPSPSLRHCERALREARSALDDPAPAAAGRRERDGLAARLRAARAKLYTRVQELRTAEDWKRWANLGVQEELCREAEALLPETDLAKASRALRELDARWKQAAQAPKPEGEKLWQRFRTARAQVRSRCAAHFSELRAARGESLRKKEALVTEAESLAASTEWARAAERMRALQAEWRTTGPVPRAKSEALWTRFRAATGRFFERQKEDRVRRRGERAKSLERREAIVAAAEALAESSEWDRGAAEVKRLQNEWRSAGPVGKDKADALNQRFRAACERFFERYRSRDQLEAAARIAEREALCASAEALAAPDAGVPEEVAERLKALQATWKSAPALSGPQSAVLSARWAAAVDAVVASRPAAFRGTDLDPSANRARLESLCETVEALSPSDSRPAAEVSPAALLAARWREALAANTMGAKTDEGAARRERRDKVEAARAAWARVGPVGGADRERLAARFRDACRRALGEGS